MEKNKFIYFFAVILATLAAAFAALAAALAAILAASAFCFAATLAALAAVEAAFLAAFAAALAVLAVALAVVDDVVEVAAVLAAAGFTNVSGAITVATNANITSFFFIVFFNQIPTCGNFARQNIFDRVILFLIDYCVPPKTLEYCIHFQLILQRGLYTVMKTNIKIIDTLEVPYNSV